MKKIEKKRDEKKEKQKQKSNRQHSCQITATTLLALNKSHRTKYELPVADVVNFTPYIISQAIPTRASEIIQSGSGTVMCPFVRTLTPHLQTQIHIPFTSTEINSNSVKINSPSEDDKKSQQQNEVEPQIISSIYLEEDLPFVLDIKEYEMRLPFGLHSATKASIDGVHILLGGRTNGLHGFSSSQPNFAVSNQNTTAIVLDFTKKRVTVRSLLDPRLGLTLEQLEYLTVSAAQSIQDESRLYLVGGYGYCTNSGKCSTKPRFTALNLRTLSNWIRGKLLTITTKETIEIKPIIEIEIENEIFQVTGGEMLRFGQLFMLVFGQNYDGDYLAGGKQTYTQEIRRFVLDAREKLCALPPTLPLDGEEKANWHRRDFNIASYIDTNGYLSGIQFGGVFTPTQGVWTRPIRFSQFGDVLNHEIINNKNLTISNAALTTATTTLLDANANTIDINSDNNQKLPVVKLEETQPIVKRSNVKENENIIKPFGQAMNHYACASVILYSRKRATTYTIFFGGISYGYIDESTIHYTTDAQIPFINQCSVITTSQYGACKQFYLKTSFPHIPFPTLRLINSSFSSSIPLSLSSPSSISYFGTNAVFLIEKSLSRYISSTNQTSEIIDLDLIECNNKKTIVLGHIVGGIQSRAPNTTSRSDTQASDYIFEVYIRSK